MFFLVDHNKKIIFGWSAKSGCSHIKKIFWYLQNNNIDNKIHIKEEYSYILPNDIKNYITILIIRNPYERLISGFLGKFKLNGFCRNKWKYPECTFSKFIDEFIINSNYKKIDEHHFTPQLSENFDNKIINSKNLIIYDINNINYKYIENIYNKIIPESLIKFRGGHENKNYNIFKDYVYNLNIDSYSQYKVPLKYYYNEELKNKVYNFYINDFLFFKKYGFDYKIEN